MNFHRSFEHQSGEAHPRRILRTYARYYNDIRTHWALDKDAPAFRLLNHQLKRDPWRTASLLRSGLGFDLTDTLLAAGFIKTSLVEDSSKGFCALAIKP